MNPLPGKCPVCSSDLVVTRLVCPACETSLEGSFAPGASRLQEAFSNEQLRSLLPFSRLNQEQLYFVLTFVRCEGRFNRMEEELGLSYPTLRSRLDELIRAMGFEPSRSEEPADIPPGIPPGLSPEERQAILDLLEKGEINVEEASSRLRGIAGAQNDDERLKILQMVQEGQIIPEAAAELLQALETGRGQVNVNRYSPAQQPMVVDEERVPAAKPRWLRVRVTDTDTGKPRVNVRVPMSLVNLGLKMGVQFTPEIEGVDLATILAAVQTLEPGPFVDVYDEDDGEHVEVYLE